MKITDGIFYVGVNDHEVTLFEGQYQVPNGMAYNSYVILDEKIAVMDTVDEAFGQQWIANVEAVIQGRKPDYLVVQHMEPDHSANIPLFLEKYPETEIVATPQAFKMMNQFYSLDPSVKQVPAANGGELALGEHKLNFVYAPMVHWPEVMMTYESRDKVLFSADGFGKFGTRDADEAWTCEARRYYMNICGKYGAQVQALLKKAADLDIAAICPLHGPVLTEDLDYYIGKYQTWSSYEPEDEGILIACASVHGNTMTAALKLKEILEAKGAKKVVLADLCRDDMHEAVEDAFRYSHLVLAAITYDAGIFPAMESFLNKLKAKNYQKRTVGLMENGTWAPTAGKSMKAALEGMKELSIAEQMVTIKSALKPNDISQLEALAEELLA